MTIHYRKTLFLIDLYSVSLFLSLLIDSQLDDDYYPLALANYLRRQQAAMAAAASGASGPGGALSGPAGGPGSADKRGSCLKRGAGCSSSGGGIECCEGSACRCNLFGSNCRCQRAGLLQKLI